jgi:hypothetical protein
LNGDGKADILTAAGPGGNAQIRAVDGSTLKSLDAFFAFDATFLGGAYVS